MGDRRGVGSSLMYLTDVARDQHDYTEARALLHESLVSAVDGGDHWTLVEALERCARLEAAEGQMSRAARLFGATEALLERLGGAVRVAERAEHERAVTALRTILRTEAFVAAWTEGRSMTLDQAIGYARSSEGSSSRDDMAPASDSTCGQASADPCVFLLTPRERQVTALVARGLTDPQIAAMLCIGTRTVETHVASSRASLPWRPALNSPSGQWSMGSSQSLTDLRQPTQPFRGTACGCGGRPGAEKSVRLFRTCTRPASTDRP